jgi:hypothetical protein
LLIGGSMHIYSGPFSSLKKASKVDKSVKNFATAVDHEYRYHINIAIVGVDALLKQLEQTGFGSEAACYAGCAAVSGKVNKLFDSILQQTQAKELGK